MIAMAYEMIGNLNEAINFYSNAILKSFGLKSSDYDIFSEVLYIIRIMSGRLFSIT